MTEQIPLKGKATDGPRNFNSHTTRSLRLLEELPLTLFLFYFLRIERGKERELGKKHTWYKEKADSKTGPVSPVKGFAPILKVEAKNIS